MNTAVTLYLKRYFVGFGVALLLHIFIVAGLQIGLDTFGDENRRFVIEPKPLKAQLIQLRRPTTVQAATPAQPKPTTLPVMNNDEDTPEPTKEIETAEEQRERLERERQQKLTELRDRAFQDAVGDEILATRESAVQDLAQEYINGIYLAVVENWNRPPSASNDMSVVILVELFPNGEVNSLGVSASSGHEPFDRSAVNAIYRAAPFVVPDDLGLFEERFRTFTLNFKPEDLLR